MFRRRLQHKGGIFRKISAGKQRNVRGEPLPAKRLEFFHADRPVKKIELESFFKSKLRETIFSSFLFDRKRNVLNRIDIIVT